MRILYGLHPSSDWPGARSGLRKSLQLRKRKERKKNLSTFSYRSSTAVVCPFGYIFNCFSSHSLSLHLVLQSPLVYISVVVSLWLSSTASVPILYPFTLFFNLLSWFVFRSSSKVCLKSRGLKRNFCEELVWELN
ncbi:hypothetical protein CEXT_86921 [Caerostris extrusa]|uniref:Uncharacterized protein n=1 Tax=Caerostris extrusa TaxID=172846 RepID=A0AAV4SPN9_CAEEX|nr:hypothetical protein CEXT_86921 [Caerostris extrusa]